ncbi:MAG: signal recognition particle-docking protein FtsY [Rickettsiales bacterium]
MSLFKIFSKAKITDQLKNSSQKFSQAISEIFTHKKLDENTIELLEETLIINDLGADFSMELIKNLREKKFNKNVNIEEIKQFLAEEITRILKPCEGKIQFDSKHKPQVIIFNGVNGAGKTTTIGKIANNLSSQNKKVLIVGCDTFRAGAGSQLEVWAKRANCEIILSLKDGEDPASVAYRGVDYAKKNDFDVVLIDTAGRLQNKQNLMDELKKINNVIKKLDDSAPHLNLLIVDATIGQNSKMQTEIFNQTVGIDGLIITKLDGSSKGGVVVGISKIFGKPIYAIGIGEKIEDLQEFDAKEYAQKLVN